MNCSTRKFSKRNLSTITWQTTNIVWIAWKCQWILRVVSALPEYFCINHRYPIVIPYPLNNTVFIHRILIVLHPLPDILPLRTGNRPGDGFLLLFCAEHVFPTNKLTSNLHRRAAGDDSAAVGGGVAHAGGGLAADHDGGGAFDDGVGRADAGAHVAHDGRRHLADEDRGDAGADDRTSHMRDGRDARCLHRAGVHVCKSYCRGHIVPF